MRKTFFIFHIEAHKNVNVRCFVFILAIRTWVICTTRIMRVAPSCHGPRANTSHPISAISLYWRKARRKSKKTSKFEVSKIKVKIHSRETSWLKEFKFKILSRIQDVRPVFYCFHFRFTICTYILPFKKIFLTHFSYRIVGHRKLSMGI